jgi:hypothetical protein
MVPSSTGKWVVTEDLIEEEVLVNPKVVDEWVDPVVVEDHIQRVIAKKKRRICQK